jgi:IclR family acetate operon transcriptional repressor
LYSNTISEGLLAVNANKSGARLLSLIEQIARSQPIGVRQLARDMDLEKRAVQRLITTLAESGWIQPVDNAGWELSARILHVAHMAHGGNSLRQQARPALEALRDATGETAYLAIPDGDAFIVVEVAESRQSLRTVVPLGSILPADDPATVGAILPYLASEQRQQLADILAPEYIRTIWHEALEVGYSVARDPDDANSVTIAVPVLGRHGEVTGVISVRAVGARIDATQQKQVGTLLLEKQQQLSLSRRRALRPSDIRNAIGGFG